jgi:hypothetical protein
MDDLYRDEGYSLPALIFIKLQSFALRVEQMLELFKYFA